METLSAPSRATWVRVAGVVIWTRQVAWPNPFSAYSHSCILAYEKDDVVGCTPRIGRRCRRFLLLADAPAAGTAATARRDGGQSAAQESADAIPAFQAGVGEISRDRRRGELSDQSRQLSALHVIRLAGGGRRYPETRRGVCPLLSVVSAGISKPGIPQGIFQRPLGGGDR